MHVLKIRNNTFAFSAKGTSQLTLRLTSHNYFSDETIKLFHLFHGIFLFVVACEIIVTKYKLRAQPLFQLEARHRMTFEFLSNKLFCTFLAEINRELMPARDRS